MPERPRNTMVTSKKPHYLTTGGLRKQKKKEEHKRASKSTRNGTEYSPLHSRRQGELADIIGKGGGVSRGNFLISLSRGNQLLHILLESNNTSIPTASTLFCDAQVLGRRNLPSQFLSLRGRNGHGNGTVQQLNAVGHPLGIGVLGPLQIPKS